MAKYRERTRGRVEMPITIRIPSFGGIRGKEHHGESPETYYVHTAGLKVVVPVDARSTRTACSAWRSPTPIPVIVLEPKARYWSKEDGELTVDGPGHRRGADRCASGDACTVVTYGAMVAALPRGRRGARSRTRGSTRACVDLRSLSPLDLDAARRAAPGRPAGSSWCTRRRGRSGWAPRSPRA